MHRSILLFFTLFLLIVHNIHSTEVIHSIDLNTGWCIQSGNGSVHQCGVSLPAYVHTVLFQRGLIPDPYFRFNDVQLRWVALEDWSFSNQFSFDKASQERMVLEFKGLDTVCDIYLNNQWLGRNTDMFHELSFDVTDLLRTSNLLVLNFQSAIHYAKSQSTKSLYPIPTSDNEQIQHGELHRNFVRKTQSSFSWDWGPCFAPTGIWKEVSLLSIPNSFYLKNVLVETFPTVDFEKEVKRASTEKEIKPLQSSNFKVNATLVLDASATTQNIKLAVSIQKDGQIVCTNSQILSTLPPGVNKITITLFCDQVSLWYPVGYGPQPLYTLQATASTPNSEPLQLQKTIGFRDFKVIQKPIGSHDPVNNPSKTFYFQVNGIPVFAKGSNYIPPDSFLDRVKDQDVKNLLDSFLEANQNTLRIWGGGNFERDVLYSYCDERGIMVWQEFMFACAVYPRDDAFLNDIRQEVEQQVSRLMHHPSIIMWSGSNENEASLWGDTWYNPIISSNTNKMRYIVDYGTLYFDTVRQVLLSVDQSRAFWPSSPSKGVISEQPYVGYWINPYGTQLGDVHYYDYSTVCTDVNNFPLARFMSEYGHQSFASLETFKAVTIPQDLFYNSTLMNHRQHHPDGTQQILFQIANHFPSGNLNDFERFTYFSQCSQAVCMKAQSEYYRSKRDDPNVQTYGALYWQLNSIWQTVDWASLEYGGKWKVMHYMVKQFFSPTLILSYEQGGWFKVFVTTDSLTQLSLSATVSIIQYSDGSVKKTMSFPDLSIKPLSGQMVMAKLSESIILESLCWLSDRCFVHLSLSDGQTVVSENVHFLSSLSKVDLPNATIKIASSRTIDERTVEVTLISNHVAFYVWIESNKYQGRFDRNALMMLKEREEKVIFRANSAISNVNDFLNSISTRHVAQ